MALKLFSRGLEDRVVDGQFEDAVPGKGQRASSWRVPFAAVHPAFQAPLHAHGHMHVQLINPTTGGLIMAPVDSELRLITLRPDPSTIPAPAATTAAGTASSPVGSPPAAAAVGPGLGPRSPATPAQAAVAAGGTGASSPSSPASASRSSGSGSGAAAAGGAGAGRGPARPGLRITQRILSQVGGAFCELLWWGCEVVSFSVSRLGRTLGLPVYTPWSVYGLPLTLTLTQRLTIMFLQVRFSDLETPRDVDVVVAALAEEEEAARVVVAPPSTWAADLAPLLAAATRLGDTHDRGTSLGHAAAPEGPMEDVEVEGPGGSGSSGGRRPESPGKRHKPGGWGST